MKRSKTKLIFICMAITLSAFACNSSNLRQDKVLQLKQFKLSVQLADTPQERATGLSGVPQLKDSEGMLFLFSEPEIQRFWMKGMLIPIDIIWIKDDQIVGITDNIRTQPNVADSDLTLYTSPSEVDKVLEVNSGWAFRHDIQTGVTIGGLKP